MSVLESGAAAIFRKARRESDLELKEIAKRAGYENLNKGMRRMQELEQKGNFFPHPEIRRRFARVLDVAEEDLEEAMLQDFRQMDEPVDPRIIVRYMSAVYSEAELPEDCTRAEAEEEAARIAQEKGYRCCLVLSKIRGRYYERDGSTHEHYWLPVGGLLKVGNGDLMSSLDRFLDEQGIEP